MHHSATWRTGALFAPAPLWPTIANEPTSLMPGRFAKVLGGIGGKERQCISGWQPKRSEQKR